MTVSWRGPTLMLLLVAALYVAVRPWLIDAVGPQLLVAAVCGGAVVVGVTIAWWQARTRRYICPACSHTFTVSMLRNLLSQNWFGRLRATCPSCKTRSWCESEPA